MLTKTALRFLDIFFSIIILTLSFPLLIIVSILIAVNMGLPVVFHQKRLGLNNKEFKFFKFRSMIDNSSLSDAERITKLGRIIRKLSIDELPQLYNVLKGDMSLVGPRPLLPEYKEHYTKEQIRRHDVRPGITGWAQVNGRNNLSWERKFELDVYYVDNYSIGLYFRTLYKTIMVVLFARDFSLSGEEKRFDQK